MRAICCSALTLCLALFGCGDETPSPKEKTGPKLPPACPDGVPMSYYSGKPLVDFYVNDEGPYEGVFDTGAPDTILSDSLLVTLGEDGPYTIRAGGQSTTVENLWFGDLWDYYYDVDAILGLDIFGKYVISIDYGRDRFWFDTTLNEENLLACSHLEGSPSVSEMKQSDYLYVRGHAEELEGWFLLDSGASLGVLTDNTFASLQTAHPRPALVGFYTPAAIGTFYAQLTNTAFVGVDGLRVNDILTRTIPEGYLPPPSFMEANERLLGVLPSLFLAHFLVTVDITGERLRIDALRGSSMHGYKVYPFGIGLESKTTLPVHIAQILEGSSAEEEGLLVGDEMVSVHGLTMEEITPYQRPWYLVTLSPGEESRVVVKRGDETISVMLSSRDLLTAPSL